MIDQLPPEKRRDLGEKVAETLLQEMKISDGVKFQNSYKLLLDCVPGREGPDKVSFFTHQENGKKIEPTKEHLLKKMELNTESGERKLINFCCASLIVDVAVSFEIDHVFPFALIKKRQETLLELLNKDKHFAEGFFKTALSVEFTMKVEVKGKIQVQKKQIKINDYFQKAPKDNKIKGTKFFYEVCYNDISNLLHIKHHINRDKKRWTT